ncbi:hypothetical protein, partial [Trichococcus flocculiformis]|uniref:hypothetical protein n=1 Tax=Trichococcus flocculiformis TaxID=82803 RepID=UPI0023F1F436
MNGIADVLSVGSSRLYTDLLSVIYVVDAQSWRQLRHLISYQSLYDCVIAQITKFEFAGFAESGRSLKK